MGRLHIGKWAIHVREASRDTCEQPLERQRTPSTQGAGGYATTTEEREMREPYGRFIGAGCNPVVAGRKFCTVCGRWRQTVDFAPCTREPKLKLASWCRNCQRRKEAEAWRDPQRRDHKREYHRIWREAERRRNGVPERPFKSRERPQDSRGSLPRLYSAPLADRIVRYAEHHYGGNIEHVCEAIGVESRRLSDWRTGKHKMVHFDVADRALLGLDLHWWDVWEEPVNGHEPEKRRAYELAARAFEGV
jgi:hypothetical protein